MAYTDIDKSDDYFNTVLYSGSASSQAITGVGFQPDLIIVKNRTITGNHYTNDIIRGASQKISTNTTSTEFTQDGISSFDSDGFTVGTASTDTNNSGNNYVAWNWLASNTTASNTSGSITSTVSANTTSGFSIVSYTGTDTAGTIGHGLGVAPKMIIIKRRTAFVEDWLVYHASLGATKNLKLNTDAAEATSSAPFNDTAPTSTVFSVKDDGTTNSASSTYIAYCFAEKKGFSKFGSYTGNGSTDGTFVYTGFKPAFVIQKEYGAGGEYWMMKDNKRVGYNQTDANLYPNASNVEGDTNGIDLLSNGFKCRTTGAGSNGSGKLYIYMAFAENPFVTSTGIPTTAR
jgi:hypothetical protein